MKYKIFIGDNPITLEHDNLDNTINVDSMTTIDTGNIFGEHVTISAVVNRIGLLKAEAEKVLAEAHLDYKVFEGRYKSKLRKEAAKNKGFFTLRIENEDVLVKLTEKSLDSSYESDEEWIKIKKKHIKAEANVALLTSLYWSCQDKARKLNGLVGGTTPEEYVNKMIEGKVNGILIKKR